jgi:hypothetical protein
MTYRLLRHKGIIDSPGGGSIFDYDPRHNRNVSKTPVVSMVIVSVFGGISGSLWE